MADAAKAVQAVPVTKRAAERVKMARLTSPLHVFGQQVLVLAGGKDGARCSSIALHPSGLVVVPVAGAFAGQRVIVPAAQVEYAILADDEG